MTPIGTVRSSRTATEDDDWDSVVSSIELDASQLEFGPRGAVKQPDWMTELMRQYWVARP